MGLELESIFAWFWFTDFRIVTGVEWNEIWNGKAPEFPVTRRFPVVSPYGFRPGCFRAKPKRGGYGERCTRDQKTPLLRR